MKRGSVLNRVADRYLGIPFLASTSVFSRRRKLPGTVERIGITASPTMGDTLLTSAAIRDLKMRYPNARFLFFATSAAASAADLLPGIDEIVPINLTSPRTTLSAFRNAKLDLLVDFTAWQRLTAFYAAFSGARFRLGFRTPGQHRHWHYDGTAPHSREMHEIDNFRALVGALGLEPSHAPALHTPWIGTLPEPFPGEEVIVFHAWASLDRHSIREWPETSWVQLAQALAQPGTRFVITGGPAQRPKSDALCTALANAGLQATVFQGAQGLRSLAVLLRQAALLVSVNTGVMHLAALLGTPVVAINGPTSPLRWGPWGDNSFSVEPRGGGGGYLHLGFEFEGQAADVMERTHVEDVAAAAEKLRRTPASAVPEESSSAPA